MILLPHRIRKISSQGEQQPHGMLRHGHGENSLGIGHQNSRIAQFGIHELCHARGGRVNPLQLPGILELLRAQRVAHKNVRVRKLFRQTVIVRQMDDAHLRPAPPNGIGHDRFWPPLGKRMPDADDKLCTRRCSALHHQLKEGCANRCRSCRGAWVGPGRLTWSGRYRGASRQASGVNGRLP